MPSDAEIRRQARLSVPSESQLPYVQQSATSRPASSRASQRPRLPSSPTGRSHTLSPELRTA